MKVLIRVYRCELTLNTTHVWNKNRPDICRIQVVVTTNFCKGTRRKVLTSTERVIAPSIVGFLSRLRPSVGLLSRKPVVRVKGQKTHGAMSLCLRAGRLQYGARNNVAVRGKKCKWLGKRKVVFRRSIFTKIEIFNLTFLLYKERQA